MYRAGSFSAASVLQELSNIPTKAPHMQDYSYVVDHAAKPDIDNKSICLNDLEEGVKFALLADI